MVIRLHQMKKIEVQISDELYKEAKRIAKQKEISFAEVVRHGLEHVTRAYRFSNSQTNWSPPSIDPLRFKPDLTPKELKKILLLT